MKNSLSAVIASIPLAFGLGCIEENPSPQLVGTVSDAQMFFIPEICHNRNVDIKFYPTAPQGFMVLCEVKQSDAALFKEYHLLWLDLSESNVNVQWRDYALIQGYDPRKVKK